MSLPDVPEIPRSFVEWSTEDVVQWLSRLQLSQDYSKQFRGAYSDAAMTQWKREKERDSRRVGPIINWQQRLPEVGLWLGTWPPCMCADGVC